MGDGCMMEGISHEASALAGTWGLGKLVAFWDDNNISIDGHIEGWYTDDTPKRFESYGWHVIADVQGHDAEAIDAAINAAKAVTDKPTLICCKTVIGAGSPNKEGTHDVHGAALGDEEVAATRKHIGWNYPPFEIPAHVYEAWDARTKGADAEKLWNNKFAEYKAAFPAEATEFERRINSELPVDWAAHAAKFVAETNENAETVATRKASQNAINGLQPVLPERLGASADLTGSNLTNWKGAKHVSGKKPGNYISYGVRVFGMSHIMNGMALHGGFLPFGGTFLMFSEYARNAIRLSALMTQRLIYVFTHDSIGLGEDGPTHEPIEQISQFRAMPGFYLWRPADATENVEAWKTALTIQAPHGFVLSRQKLKTLKPTRDFGEPSRGAYIVKKRENATLTIMASGSELMPSLQAGCFLEEMGIRANVVSVPCLDLFDEQDEAYKTAVIDPVTKVLAVEAARGLEYYKYADEVMGMETFGASAPANELFKRYGFTIKGIKARATALMGVDNKPVTIEKLGEA